MKNVYSFISPYDKFLYLVISLLVLKAGCGICLFEFLIIAYLFTFHDPSSNGSPDILFTRFHRLTIQKSKKRHNSAMTSPTEKNTGPLIFHAHSTY